MAEPFLSLGAGEGADILRTVAAAACRVRTGDILRPRHGSHANRC